MGRDSVGLPRGSWYPHFVTQMSRQMRGILLAAILLLGVAVRIVWGIHQGHHADAISQLPDQQEYLELGQHLHDGDGLWFSDARFKEVVYAYRTPGYPIFISWCAADPKFVRIVQALLDGTTILAIYLLTLRWLGTGPSLIAAGIVAANPFLIFFSGLILSETLFTAMMCWGIALLILSDGPWPARRGNLIAWLCGGALLALSVLVRPGAIALPVILGCGAALANRDQRADSHTPWPLPLAATFLLLTFLALVPWAARNRLQIGSWVWTSTNDGITRYDGFNPDATGASDQSFVQSMPFLADMTETGRSQYLAKKADEWMAARPLAAMELAIVKMGRTWSPIPLSQEYGSRLRYVLVGLLYSVPLDVLVVIGLLRSGPSGAVKRLLVLPALYFTVSAALSVGSLRYRVPAEAPMAILAASALTVRNPRRAGQPQPLNGHDSPLAAHS
jgi:4-amino-4-deoxy-L-arabinose transferase-like glycosyltransferase